MPETPQDIQHKIAQIEAMRPVLGDVAADAAIAAIRAHHTPHTSQHIQAGGTISNVQQTLREGNDVQGKVHVADTLYGAAVGVNLGVIIYGRDPREDERRQLVWYLHTLAARMNSLPLQGVASKLDQRGTGVAMSSVYTMLATKRMKIFEEEWTACRFYFEGDDPQNPPKPEYHPDNVLPSQAIDLPLIGYDSRRGLTGEMLMEIRKPLLATEAVRDTPLLALLGDPGSGKSTFLRHMTYLLARRELGETSTQETLPDGMKPRLPILLPLQKLARRLAQDGSEPAVVFAALLAEMERYDVEQGGNLLREALHNGAALLLFDGLDEVPTTGETSVRADRLTTLHAVRTFTASYPNAAAVLTCRSRAFSDELRKCLGWPVETLAPFTLGQVRHFVPAWYAELAAKGHLEQERADRLHTTLIDSIVTRPRLHEMAETPLLLTMMAAVLYEKGELPRDRPMLYEAILTLLLGQWDHVRDSQSLADAIGSIEWESERIRPVLHWLSYEAHLGATSEDGRGRLAWAAIHKALIVHFEEAGMRRDVAAGAAVRCLEYIEQRSGLLQPDEQESFVFAHLTLQEHCAGQALVTARDSVGLLMQHRADDRWREPIFLGLGAAQRSNPFLIESVLHKLIDRDEGEQPKPIDRWQRDLILAADIGVDRDWGYLRQQRVDVAPIQRDLKCGLVALLNDKNQPLPIAERIRAGYLLGDLGDPRLLDPTTGNAPAGDYWCSIEPGPFWFGDDRNEELRQKTLPYRYRIGRYPVTNAEYARFVEAGGYADRQWWTEQGWSWRESQNRTQPYQWDNETWNAPNQPVVGVSWYEAVAYCAWLTAQGRAAGWLAAGEVIRLPTSLEWERAARGTDRRRYPWGDEEPSEEHANYGEHVGKTTPIGCYPQGIAACGALDMAGQVWEWLATPDGSREQVEPQADSDPNSDMLLTYDSWLCQTEHLCCGSRNGNYPQVRDNYWGFRLLPPSLKEQ